MQTTTASGTLIQHPDGTEIRSAATGRRRRGGATTDPISEALLQGLTAQALTRGDDIAIAPAAGPTGRRAAPAATEGVTLAVPTGPDEAAVLLVERDGVYAWQFPEPAGPRRTLRAPPGTTVFRIGPGADASPLGQRRGVIDALAGAILEPVRAVVLKFVARALVGAGRAKLEQHVKPGLVDMSSLDPREWKAAASRPLGKRADGGSPRVLLLVHGTFSSSVGSFGALGATAWGRSFLEQARGQYDAVLGYDHATLSATPEDNARALLDALRGLGGAGARIDAVAYSRGGLVYRALTERLVRQSNWPVDFGRAVFVGCTNGGTALADPANWRRYLDLYTNLAAAAGRGISLLDGGIAGTVLTESVKTLGGLVQAVVGAAIEEDMLPGIAAMRPQSRLVSELNAAPAAPGGEYYAMGASFDLGLAASIEASVSGLPGRLARALLHDAAQRLMGEANDLVVDTEAMTAFGGHAGQLADHFTWDHSPEIYHTNYFLQRAVVDRTRTWLSQGATPSIGQPGQVGSQAVAAPAPESEPEQGGSFESLIKRGGGLVGALPGKAMTAPPPRRPKVPLPGPGSGGAGDLSFTGRRERPSKASRVPPPLLGEDDGDDGAVEGEAVPAKARHKASAPPRFHETRRSAPATASRGASKAPLPRTDPPQDVACHFAAEMAEHPPLEKPAPLSVTVSREDIAITAGPTSQTAEARVRTGTPITLSLEPRRNCEVVGAASVEVDPPEAGKPETYDFKVSGLQAGPAELWVEAHQGARRLMRMVLQPDFVATTATLRAGANANPREPDPPMVELRIYEDSEGEDRPFRLHFVLESRDLGVQLDSQTKQFPVSQKAYVDTLYGKLEGNWGKNSDDFDCFMSDLADFGAELYTDLVPQEMRQTLWDYRDRIGAIEVISHEPYIPWEAAHLVEPGKPLPPGGNQFLAELGLIRWVCNAGFAPARLRVRNGQARFVIPDYPAPGWKLPGAAEEIALLKSTFNATAAPVNTRDLKVLLAQEDGFDLLHFACHGLADPSRIWEASLAMEGRIDGDGTYVQDKLELTSIRQRASLKHADGSRPIVFLNACQAGRTGRTLSGTGGMADAFVRAGAGLFVGTLWSIGDDTARGFARAFYEGLRSGANLTQATRAARQAARQAREPTWLAYTVYGHPYALLEE